MILIHALHDCLQVRKNLLILPCFLLTSFTRLPSSSLLILHLVLIFLVSGSVEPIFSTLLSSVLNVWKMSKKQLQIVISRFVWFNCFNQIWTWHELMMSLIHNNLDPIYLMSVCTQNAFFVFLSRSGYSRSSVKMCDSSKNGSGNWYVPIHNDPAIKYLQM